MRYKKLGDTYVLRLSSKENVIETIKEFCLEIEIGSAQLSGIGAISDPKLAYFDDKKKGYNEKSFFGDFELLGLNGNIAVCDDDIVVHAHVALADKDFKAIGGHLLDATTGATLELFITPLKGDLYRAIDRNYGLKLLDLG